VEIERREKEKELGKTDRASKGVLKKKREMYGRVREMTKKENRNVN
jgi:hypothetical protein